MQMAFVCLWWRKNKLSVLRLEHFASCRIFPISLAQKIDKNDGNDGEKSVEKISFVYQKIRVNESFRTDQKLKKQQKKCPKFDYCKI